MGEIWVEAITGDGEGTREETPREVSSNFSAVVASMVRRRPLG